MKRYAKPTTALPAPAAIPDGTFDVVELLGKSSELLRREILNLMAESARGKLSPNSAKDLVAYIKLLNELKQEQEEALAKLDDDELKKLVSGS